MASNNNLQTVQQTSRLDFLFTAGFEMLSKVPSLSRYYMNEFQHSLTEYELTTVKNISRLACTSCGQIAIPGLSTRVEIKQKKVKRKQVKGNKIDKKNKTQKKNAVHTICLTCSHTNAYHGSYKKKIPKVTNHRIPVITNNVNKSSITTLSDVSSTTKEDMTSSLNKKKKNKGKKNNLKALLSKSSSNNNNNSGGSGLLSDFLSSL